MGRGRTRAVLALALAVALVPGAALGPPAAGAVAVSPAEGPAATVDAAGCDSTTATATINRIAGGGSSVGDGVVAAKALLAMPRGTAVDAGGNVFVADYQDHRVRRIDAATGVITTVAGDGTQGFADGVPPYKGSLMWPSGVAVDAAGNVYVADSGNHRVRKVVAATGAVTTVAGTGVYGVSGDGGPATSAAVGNPEDVAVDPAGRVVIAEPNFDRIRRLDPATGIITTIAGTGTRAFAGDGGPATAAALDTPRAVAVDATGNLFIADNANSRVRRIDAGTGIITTAAGNGSTGTSGDGGPGTSASVGLPTGVAVDGAGDLLIVTQNRLRKVDHTTGIITTVAGTGQVTPAGDGGPATAAALGMPDRVGIGPGGSILLDDWAAKSLRRIDIGTGTIDRHAGNGTGAYLGEDVPALLAHLSTGGGLAHDPAGNLFVTDTTHHVVRRIDAATGVATTVAGTGTAGAAGDGGPALSAQLQHPVHLGADGAGNLFVDDGGGVRRIDAATGTIATVFGGPLAAGGVAGSGPLAVTADGTLFVAVGFRVHRLAAGDTTATVVAGTGANASSGDGGPATAAAIQPGDLAVDGGGNVYVSETNRIRRIDAATGVINTVVGTGDPGPAGDGGPATAARISGTPNVTLNAAGDLFLTGFGRVRRVDATTGIIQTIAGNGVGTTSAGDGGSATSLFVGMTPTELTVDPGGNLVLADIGLQLDSGAYVLRRVTPSPAGCWPAPPPPPDPSRIITTAAGGASAEGSGELATDTAIGSTSAAVADPGGNLLVATPTALWRVDGRTGVATATASNATTLAIGPDGALVTASLPAHKLTVPFGSSYPTMPSGAFGCDGDGAFAFVARLKEPNAVVVDAAKDVFVADSGCHTIRRIDGTTSIITTVAGVADSPGFDGDGGPATAAHLNKPRGLALDAAGNVFVTDAGNSRVRRIDASTGVITTVAGTGVAGYAGDGGPATSARLNQPRGLLLPGDGSLLVADAANHRIRRLDLTTGTITTAYGTGGGSGGDGGPATSAGFDYPIALAQAAGGQLLVADPVAGRVRRIDPTAGAIWTAAGGGTCPACAAQLPAPRRALQPRVAVRLLDGSIAFADGPRVYRIDPTSGLLKLVAGNGSNGFAGDGGPAVDAALSYVLGLAVDGVGNLFIADSFNARVRRVDASTGVITTLYQGAEPRGVAVGGSGALYVVDAQLRQVLRLDPATWAKTVVAGTGQIGSTGDGGPATAATFLVPTAIAVGEADDLYIADIQAHRVRRVAGSTGVISALAGTGILGYNGDGLQATSAKLNQPAGVAVEPGGGAVLIADSGNNRIRRVDLATKKIATVAGTGAAASYGDFGPAQSADVAQPMSVSVDGPGGFLIAGGGRVRRVSSDLGRRFHAVTPARVVDSRTGLGFTGPLAAGDPGVRSAAVTGVAGVPASASAVVVNVTVTEGTAGSYVTVFPAGSPVPTAANLSFGPGQTVPNHVTVRVGSGGQVSFFNAVGSVQVVADVVGWYDDGADPSGSGFFPLPPARLYDSRGGPGPVAGGETRAIPVAGLAGVGADATAVVANVTVTNPTLPSYLQVFPSGTTPGTTANLVFAAGQTVPNLVTVGVGAGGQVSVFNQQGSVDVVVDVVGYYSNGYGGRTFHPLASPTRLLDSRSDLGRWGSSPAGTGVARPVELTGGAVPAGASAVVANVTVTQPTSATYLALSPTLGPVPAPTASLLAAPGQTVPNAVTVGVGPLGHADVFNQLGSAHVIVDVAGWFGP